MTATIQLPIFLTTNPATGNPIAIGDQIELWYLNENTGIWVQEGMGAVITNINSPTGYSLEASVSHFTPWNVDIPIFDFSFIDVTVNGPSGGIATVKFRPSDVNGIPSWMNSTRSMAIGTTRTYQVAEFWSSVCVWVEYINTSGASATTTEQCVNTLIVDNSYPLTFSISSVATLELRSWSNRSSYRTDRNLNISVRPVGLETNVSYAITSGSLPAGISLIPHGNTGAKIIGSSSILGNYSVTITGTDSDGNTDTQIIGFSIVNPPAPSLRSEIYLAYNSADDINENLSSSLSYSSSVPTHWTITESDGSAVASNVTISNTGILTITSYNGTNVIYKARAYNSYGVSNAMDVYIENIATSAPRLPVSEEVYLDSSMGMITHQITPLNSVAVDSWTMTDSNNNPVNYINSTGLITSPPDGTYIITASNSNGSSNGMTVNITDMMTGGGGGPGCTPGDINCTP